MFEVAKAIHNGGCHPKCPVTCVHTGALAPPAPQSPEAPAADPAADPAATADPYTPAGVPPTPATYHLPQQALTSTDCTPRAPNLTQVP
eukprot:3772416-Pyramimonas_sp.AAC.1